MTRELRMTIGPVQGFVAQSRRTRDLWGSSYLLSFLSAHAMHGVQRHGGHIIQPSVDSDSLFRWVSADPDDPSKRGPIPSMGSVPNLFVAKLADDVDPAAVAQAGRDALLLAWTQICDAVWARFIDRWADRGDGTATIWARQTSAFWEIRWAAGDSQETGILLARRKHWSSRRLPDEPGDKCTLMPDFQELSGFVRASSQADRENQDAFWDRLRRDVGPLNLRGDERLCALALVKRLFPLEASKAIGWDLDTTRWPSTASLAAAPWLKRVCSAAPQAAATFADALRQSIPKQALHASHRAIPALASLHGPLLSIDANYFQPSFLADERVCPLSEHIPAEHHKKQRQTLIEHLGDLQNAIDHQGFPLGRPPVFHALLLADGDRLGVLASRLGGNAVSKALASFTEEVPRIVKANDGVTVYAGGDDVLALLPMNTALACASSLADRYSACFGDDQHDAKATLSAAVVFAHLRLPLSSVLHHAHHLLDEVAKDQNGRDSLAVALLKRGGLNASWVSTWQRPALDGSGPRQSATEQLQHLADALSRDLRQPGLSSALLYRLRDTLSLLCAWPQWTPGTFGALSTPLDLRPFLQAEITNSLLDQGLSEDQATALSLRLTQRLLPLLHPARANEPPPPQTPASSQQVGVDALLLARFLSSPATEEDDA